MDDQEREDLTQQSNRLRVELKVWEKDFSTANNGNKASREDIKNNPEIAAKYKEYNRTRDVLSGKILKPLPPAMLPSHTPRKRKNDGGGHGASKRQQISKTPSRTPSKGSMQPWEVDPYDSPNVVRNLFTPSRKALGPTPQKDGVVLGLFDLLQEDGSPSKLMDTKGNGKATSIHATPRKPGRDEHETLRHSRTPASAGKRVLLDAFATPLKNRDFNNQGGKTPSSVSKLHFSTPSFLRRDSQRIRLPPVHEDDQGVELSPQMVRVPRKPLVRGLSSILAGLRKLEDDAVNEDEEALREMEAEAAGSTNKPPLPSKPTSKPGLPKVTEEILVEDSQPGFPLGGFDDEAMYDSQPDEQDKNLGRDGQPLKVYKKKGQKRTTRRVRMKPAAATKAPTKAKQGNTQDSETEDELGHSPYEDLVPETQVDDELAGFEDAARNFDSDVEQSEYTASEGGTRYKRPNQARKNTSLNKDGRVKTAARKVGALAHQNFKRLKLRNSGSKGGPAHNSRFRRKR